MSNPLHALTQDYLGALLNTDKQKAYGLVMGALRAQTPIDMLFLHVFEASQHEVGRLWEMNQISVAQEHYCTAATQVIISQLYPLILKASAPNGYRMLATCVGGELHEIGIRLISDLMELNGWDTYYLGANMPQDDIVKTLEERRPHLLCVSVTMTPHLPLAAELIRGVRLLKIGQSIKILIGGYPFNQTPDLWRSFGADGSAANASETVTLANNLVSA